MKTLGHWPLIRDTKDVSGNGYHLSSSGLVTQEADGPYGHCYRIDNNAGHSTMSYLSVADFQTNKVFKNIGLSFWMKVHSFNTTFSPVVHLESSKANQIALAFDSSIDSIRYNLSGGASGNIQYDPADYLNKWVMVTSQIKDGKFKLYVNAEQVGEASCDTLPVTTMDTNMLVVAVEQDGILGGLNRSQSMDISICDLRMFEGEITDNEIKEIHKRNYFKLDIHSELQLPVQNFYTRGDSTMESYALGTVPSIVTDQTNGGVIEITREMSYTGKQSLKVSGGNNRIHMGATSFQLGDDVTMEAWVYSETAGPKVEMQFSGGDYNWDRPAADVHTGSGWELLRTTMIGLTSDTLCYAMLYNEAGETVYLDSFQLTKAIGNRRQVHTLSDPTQSTISNESPLGNPITVTGEHFGVKTDTNKNNSFGGYLSFPDHRPDSYLRVANPAEPKDELTMMCWARGESSSNYGDRSFIVSQGRDYEIYGPTLAIKSNEYVAYVGADSGNQEILYSGVAANLNDWVHLALTYNKSTGYKFYVNKELVASSTIKTISYDNSDDGLVIGKMARSYASTTNYFPLKGDVADVRCYAAEFTQDEIKDVIEARSGISKDGNIRAAQFIESGYSRTKSDYSLWEIGDTYVDKGQEPPAQEYTTVFNRNGDVTENRIGTSLNPNGKPDIMWITPENDAASAQDGGFNSGRFQVDHTKAYRFSMWVKRLDGTNGSTYFGFFGYSSMSGGSALNARYVDSGTLSANPYFKGGHDPITGDEWYLMVGIVMPYGTMSDDIPSNVRAESGVYTKNGVKVDGVSMLAWEDPATTYGAIRAYFYYSTDVDNGQIFYRPTVEELNANSRPIEDLLACGENTALLNTPGSHIRTLDTEILEANNKGHMMSSNLNESGSTKGLLISCDFTKSLKESANDSVVNTDIRKISADGMVKPIGQKYEIEYSVANNMTNNDEGKTIIVVMKFNAMTTAENFILTKESQFTMRVLESSGSYTFNRVLRPDWAWRGSLPVANPTEFNFYAMVWNNKTDKIWVNENQETITTGTRGDYNYEQTSSKNNPIELSTRELYSFDYDTTYKYVKVFDRALSDAEIKRERELMMRDCDSAGQNHKGIIPIKQFEEV